MDLSLLLEMLHQHPLWDQVTREDLFQVLKASPVKRLEILGDKIRLSRKTKLSSADLTLPKGTRTKIIPPKTLYYGTSFVGISRVKVFGIRSFKEDFVKLYADKRMIQVLVHKNSHIAYVELDAFQAHLDGVPFYKGDLNNYLVKELSPNYIRKIQ
jgi:RNA:NAD 2'-phosphotransferase (TPT1/KptA family)